MFIGPVYPPLEPEDWKPLPGDLYKQYIQELGKDRSWIYDGSDWIQYADISGISFDDPWLNLPAEQNDIYWSGPTTWMYLDGQGWMITRQNNDLKPHPNPPMDPPEGPESPNFPPDPEDDEYYKDQWDNEWWWYDGAWHTKPQSVVGDIYTTDVNTVDTESAEINDMLRVIPDVDITELNNQKDVNWAIANALEALDAQVEINSDRLDDITMLIPGASYDYERSSQYVRPPRSGAFYLGTDFAFTDVFGDARYVYIHHFDQTGTEHTFENLDVGDSIIIEHHLDAQNFGRYQVTSVTHNSDDSIIGITPVSHRGSLEPDTRYDIIAFPDLNVADKPSYEYVDTGLSNKIDRSGNNDLDISSSNWRLQANGKTFISVDNTDDTLGLYHVKYPTNDVHAANKKYVDDQVADIEAQTGYTGSAGPIGYTGSRGATGTGTQGNRGYTGSKGSKGYTGSRGSNGSNGVQIELYNSSSPASNKPRGTLLMTNTNNLYVYI